jgi:hypothetical protein
MSEEDSLEALVPRPSIAGLQLADLKSLGYCAFHPLVTLTQRRHTMWPMLLLCFSTSILGMGGFGRVDLVKHEGTGKSFALKVSARTPSCRGLAAAWYQSGHAALKYCRLDRRLPRPTLWPPARKCMWPAKRRCRTHLQPRSRSLPFMLSQAWRHP